MRNRAKLVATFLLGVTFTLGGLVGMALEEGLGIDWFEFLDTDPEPGQAILADLGLTESQKMQIEEIFERQEDDLEDYWEGRLPELQSIVDRADNQIRAVLTPRQRTLFDQRVKQRGTNIRRRGAASDGAQSASEHRSPR